MIANCLANLRASASEHERAKSGLARENTTLLQDVGKYVAKVAGSAGPAPPSPFT